MKRVTIKQNNYSELFNQSSSEPILVKNANNNYFLILPLQKMNWQQIFYNLYQLPTELVEQKYEKKINETDIDKLCGSMKGYLSSSENFAKNKQIERDLEDKKWKK
jgi:hypothetical protein